ncbi:MAG: TerB family tellurite resistance protein [Longimicrobiales bacterium]|nr:TerB family tellurite resistance protein [Longimicrobiales bacterium]
MALLGTFVAVSRPAPLSAQTLPTEDQCVFCHLSLEEDRLRVPAEAFPQDVHGAVGLDCLSCHGRSRTGSAGLDPGTGFLSVPDPTEIPAMCGRCHSDAAFMRDYNPSLRVDQEAEYASSVHGRSLVESGDPDVATCVSCHPAHRILPPTDLESSVHPLRVAELCAGCHADPDVMERHGLPTDQFDQYRNSVHGRLMFGEGDLSAPTCNDCHGNHGAAPPGVSSVRNVCGQCHAMMAQFFDGSGHREIFAASDLPGCATCHGHHAVEETSEDLLIDRAGSVCAGCHESGDTAGKEFLAMKALIDSLQLRAEESQEVLLKAENLGMEVSEALFRLDEVGNALVKARTAIHAFRLEPVEQELAPGFATVSAAREQGEDALYEHWFRRAGLALSSTIILGLIIALVLKIRHIDVRIEQVVGAVEAVFRATILAAPGATPESRRQRLRLASLALLMELAYADDEFSPAELRHLEGLIRRRFGLDPAATDALLDLVREQRARGRGVHEFADLVAHHFTVQERHDLLDAMWGMVLSVGGLAEYERRIMRELTDRLGLPSDRRTEASAGPARRWMRMFLEAMEQRRTGEGGEIGDLHLAASALLVPFLHAAGAFPDMEGDHLSLVMERHFGLTGSQARRLLRLAGESRAESFELGEMAGVIALHCSRDQKVALVDALWGLLLSDASLARREPQLMTRIMDFLGVEPEWVETRQGRGGTPVPDQGGDE